MLQEWIETELIRRFDKRILEINLKVVQKWGEIQALSEIAGTKMPVTDSMIAAIGIVYNMTIVTRDAGGMEKSGIGIFNPWE